MDRQTLAIDVGQRLEVVNASKLVFHFYRTQLAVNLAFKSKAAFARAAVV